VWAQISSNIADQDEDADAVAENGFYKVYFRDHPYGHPVAGDPAGVAAINAADLRHFAATHWVSRGLKIAIAGDVDANTLDILLKSAFGNLSAGPPRPPPPPEHPGQPGLSLIAMSVPQATAVFGLPAMLRSDPEYLAAYIANYVLGGGGFSSRLTDELREKRGLTYDVSTSLESLHRAGFVLGDVATKRGSIRETLSVLRDTLRDFAQDGPTDEELADAKTYLTGSYPLAFGSNVGTAEQLNTFERIGLPVDYVRNRNALITAVTLDQVKRAAARLFDPAKLTVVVAGSLGAAPGSGSHATAGSVGSQSSPSSRRWTLCAEECGFC
jgi:zinc protease